MSLEDWAAFRLADHQGKGVEVEARLAEHQLMLSRLGALAAARPPLALKDLALDGAALMRLAGRSGGPWLGELQRHLLEAVLDDPAANTAPSLGRLAMERLGQP